MRNDTHENDEDANHACPPEDQWIREKKREWSSALKSPVFYEKAKKPHSSRHASSPDSQRNDGSEDIAPERATSRYKLKMRGMLGIIGDLWLISDLNRAFQERFDIDLHFPPLGKKFHGVRAGLRLGVRCGDVSLRIIIGSGIGIGEDTQNRCPHDRMRLFKLHRFDTASYAINQKDDTHYCYRGW